MKTDYDKEAAALLAGMGVRFGARFVKHDKHFPDDAEMRDIFRCTFRRGGRAFSVRFGQSINDSTGCGDKKPTAYSVLACITKSDPGTLEDFCGEFGYDPDSRKAEKIWRATCEEWERVSAFFTVEEVAQIQEIN